MQQNNVFACIISIFHLLKTLLSAQELLSSHPYKHEMTQRPDSLCDSFSWRRLETTQTKLDKSALTLINQVIAKCLKMLISTVRK